MYLTQMGEIPLLKRETGNRPGQEDRSHAQALPSQSAGMRWGSGQVVETLKRVHSGELPFDRTVKVSLTENLEKDKILQRDAAQSEDARTSDGAESGGLRQDPRSAPRRGATSAQLRRTSAHPPPQGRHARRGTVHPHAEGPAADEEAGADVSADGRVGAANRRAATATESPQRGPGQPRKRTARLHDADAGGAGQPPQARRDRPASASPSTSRPSATCPAATCVWSCPSPRSIAIAA